LQRIVLKWILKKYRSMALTEVAVDMNHR